MKKILSLLILSLASASSVSAFAVTQQTGVNFGVNVGGASVNSPSLNNTSSSNRNYVLGGSIGYNYAVNSNVGTGLEANYTNFGKTNYSGSTNSGNFANSALQLLLTGTYLMDNGFNTFVKVGAANQQTSSKTPLSTFHESGKLVEPKGKIGSREIPNSFSVLPSITSNLSTSFFRRLHDEFITEHRHSDPKIQREYDQRFGLVVKGALSH